MIYAAVMHSSKNVLVQGLHNAHCVMTPVKALGIPDVCPFHRNLEQNVLYVSGGMRAIGDALYVRAFVCV